MEGNRAEQCKWAIVQATIERVDDKTVTFRTRGVRRTGELDQHMRSAFTVPLEEVYTTPIDGAPPPVAMTPGASGNLYLSRAGWKTISPDGCTIHGAEQAVFKWPDCAGIATPVLTKLGVVPTSIIVRGHIEGETELFDIELLGPDAATSQDFTWNGADLIELRLTSRGARRLRADAHALAIRVWPTRITVKGSPAIDPTLVGEVDVLDLELARGTQHIAFAAHGSPVTLWLTQDGVSAYHVTPQLVAELSGHARTGTCT